MAEKTSGKSQAKSRSQQGGKQQGQSKQGQDAARQRSAGVNGASGSKKGSQAQRGGQSAARGRGGREEDRNPRRQAEDQQGRREQSQDQDQPQEEGGGKLRRAGSAVAGGVKQHPVAAAALGAGLTLLAAQGLRLVIGSAAGGSASGSEEGEDEQQGSYEGEGAEGSYDEGEEGGEDDAGGASEGDEGEGEEGGSGGRLGRFGTAVKRGAGSGFERGRQIAAGGWHNHPLFMCAAAFAAGAAAGFILPKTGQEDRLLGKSSDKLAGRFKAAASEMFTQGRTIASRAVNEAVETTKKEFEKEGLSPDRLGKKVKRVVSHVREAVSNAVQED